MATNDLAAQQAALDKQLADNANQLKTATATMQQPAGGPAAKTWWRVDEAMTISAVVLAFGALVLILAVFLLRKTEVTAESVLRVFGTILIIVCSIFLVVAGYTDQQMGPVMGLLGTIAGYLLGKGNPPPPGDSSKSEGK